MERMKQNPGTANSSLVSAFYPHAVADFDRIALAAGGVSYSHRKLAGISQQVAVFLKVRRAATECSCDGAMPKRALLDPDDKIVCCKNGTLDTPNDSL